MSKKQNTPTDTIQFHKMGIDDRILEGIAKMKWQQPTRIQENAIPFVMDGKTVIAEARTGSGKTGAFLIPSLHRVLSGKALATKQNVQVLILAPTKELCRQIAEMAAKLTVSCSREIRILDLSPHLPLDHQKSLLKDFPDVVVGPPRRILAHVKEGNLNLDDILSVIVDEADLMLAFHHNDAIEELWTHMPPYFQCFVTSATLGKDMRYIKDFLCVRESNMQALSDSVVILRLKEPPLPDSSQLTHYVIKLEEFEKSVLLLHIFKNDLLTGKTIIFVADISRGYKLRMFLSQFGVATCILNCELAANARCDIIEQFNAGIYQTIIATDEIPGQGSKDGPLKNVDLDMESGTSRGLDFQFVSNIINYDFPTSSTAYIHRVGRTARVDNQGTALSMVSVAEQPVYNSVKEDLSSLMEVNDKRRGSLYEGIFKKFAFDIEKYDILRYRAMDPWHACTKNKILTTRKKEIAQQLLNSKKLDVYFKKHSRDKALLRHDKNEHGIRTMQHLRNMPDYNLHEESLESSSGKNPSNKKVKRLGASKPDKKIKGKKALSSNMKKKLIQSKDPLKKMEFKGFNK